MNKKDVLHIILSVEITLLVIELGIIIASMMI